MLPQPTLEEDKDMLQVQAIMTPKPQIIGPDAKIWEAANTMLDRRVSGLPVVDKTGTLVGIISESDFLRRGEIHTEARRGVWRTLFSSPGRLAEDYAKAFGKQVDEVMSTSVVTVAPDVGMDVAAKLMAEKNIKRLPVVENGRIVGIVTRSDIMAAMVRQLASFGAVKTDLDIRSALEAELQRQSWGESVRFDVAQGVVTLTGKVLDPREKTGLRVVAENTSGVRRVEDRIEVIVPPAMPVPPPGFYP